MEQLTTIEKCKYCEGEINDRLNLLEFEDDFAEIMVYIDGKNNLTESAYNTKIKINYCPICGKRLGE